MVKESFPGLDEPGSGSKTSNLPRFTLVVLPFKTVSVRFDCFRIFVGDQIDTIATTVDREMFKTFGLESFIGSPLFGHKYTFSGYSLYDDGFQQRPPSVVTLLTQGFSLPCGIHPHIPVFAVILIFNSGN
ncbi:unnamed protein product [Schistocephalus solidus]|uniref:Uncharacterized protein n=1 Tax=Schistocephalus solidus TaxID=70667 RepID=A0A183SLB9_SCHSO|nr:unnamed protein product [Schistocephalus solidus]